MNNLEQIAVQCEEAIRSSDRENIQKLIQELEKKLENDISGDCQCSVHYFLGNLYSELSSLLEEKVSGWRNDNYPESLTAAINHFRRAEKLLSEDTRGIKNEVRTNLADALARQGRSIEIFDYWKCDFNIQGEAPFVSTLRKAQELLWLSVWLNDCNHARIYQYEAYLLIKKLQNNLSETDHPRIVNSLKNSLKNDEIAWLLENGGKLSMSFSDWQKKHNPDSYSVEEKQYRAWCLESNLFVNSINDVTKEWIADQDMLQFPDHTVSVREGPYFPYLSAAFSSLKREFCFARFMAFEGVNRIHPTYENKKLFLTDTPDYVRYDGAVEKIKTAFRICFSVLDSVASLMNSYFECKVKPSSFSSKWIKENFRNRDENYFIDSLYWLSCDLTDNPVLTGNADKWKAPKPAIAEIRKIRNAIEHGWLRVAEEGQTRDTKNDFAHVISPEELYKQTLSLLKLVRSAILYFCMAVSYNEKKRKHPEGLVVSTPILLIDDDLVSLKKLSSF